MRAQSGVVGGSELRASAAVGAFVMTDETEAGPAGIDPARLDEIEALAKRATPGPWAAYDSNEGTWPPRPGWSVANDAFHNPPADDEDAPWIAVDLHVGQQADAEFIAAADPSTVLALIARTRAVEDALQEARAEVAREQVHCNDERFRLAGQRDEARAERLAELAGATGQALDNRDAELAAAHRALDAVTGEEPMNQDEMGGCVWCGGTPPGERYGYATADPADHDPDCEWLAARRMLAASRPSPPDPQAVGDYYRPCAGCDSVGESCRAAQCLAVRHPQAVAEPESRRWDVSPAINRTASMRRQAELIVAWVNANRGEARYEPPSYPGQGPLIVVRMKYSEDYAEPGDEVVKGEWFIPNGWATAADESLQRRLREFTVRRPVEQDPQIEDGA